LHLFPFVQTPGGVYHNQRSKPSIPPGKITSPAEGFNLLYRLNFLTYKAQLGSHDPRDIISLRNLFWVHFPRGIIKEEFNPRPFITLPPPNP